MYAAPSHRQMMGSVVIRDLMDDLNEQRIHRECRLMIPAARQWGERALQSANGRFSQTSEDPETPPAHSIITGLSPRLSHGPPLISVCIHNTCYCWRCVCPNSRAYNGCSIMIHINPDWTALFLKAIYGLFLGCVTPKLLIIRAKISPKPGFKELEI